jgi:hypothetical protein
MARVGEANEFDEPSCRPRVTLAHPPEVSCGMCGGRNCLDPSRFGRTLFYPEADRTAHGDIRHPGGLAPAAEGSLAEGNLASSDSASHVNLLGSLPARFRLRVVSMEMVCSQFLALLVLSVRKAMGALGIYLRVLERRLLILGTRSCPNRVRDRQRPVNGASRGNGHMGFLTGAENHVFSQPARQLAPFQP